MPRAYKPHPREPWTDAEGNPPADGRSKPTSAERAKKTRALNLENIQAYDRERNKVRQNEPIEKMRKARVQQIMTDAKQFIAWDGEGITDMTDVVTTLYEGTIHKPYTVHRQHFVLFGASTGDYVRADHLTANQCLDLMLDVERQNPEAIHVIFSGNYDIVKILEGWPENVLRDIHKGKRTTYDGYTISYRARKMFELSSGGVTLTLYDVWPFFNCAFLVSCREYLGEIPELDSIQKGKDSRGSFTADRLDSEIIPYWRTELELLVRLCETLRGSLLRIGIRGNKWYGPGAIANVLFHTYGVSRHMADYTRSDELQRALQCSYAGGRFEQFRVGMHDGPVWVYDINSAYPAAATSLPSLAGGHWERVEAKDFDGTIDPFSLYRVAFDLTDSRVFDHEFNRMPNPLPFRDKRSCIFFPNQIQSGWYRGIELENLKWFEQDTWAIGESWRFTPGNQVARPFGFLTGMYLQRLKYKEEQNPTQYALKVSYNSVYGKMAQHTGYDPSRGEASIPKWHQLEWASFITASCRTKLYRAMMEAYTTDPESLIAVETDSITVTKPLEGLDIGTGLGQWSESKYDSLLYLQSGVYFLNGQRGKAKTRGIESGKIDFDSTLDYLSRYGTSESVDKLIGRTHRFGSFGQHLGKATLGQWFDQPRELGISESVGKRIHDPSNCDRCPDSMAASTHNLVPAERGYGPSYPYELPWIGRGITHGFKLTDEYDQPSMFE